VTHYAEALPSQDIDHVALQFTEQYQQANSQDDYYSIQNQLERLQQRRSQQLAENSKLLKPERLTSRSQKQFMCRLMSRKVTIICLRTILVTNHITMVINIIGITQSKGIINTQSPL